MMRNLLYKEFRLAIHPFFFILPVLTGALMLIPQWVFFLVPLYFCFTTVPNLFGSYKAGNDLGFSVLLPVRGRDIVKARIVSFSILELLQIAAAVVFAILNRVLYHTENLFFNLNPAFFGIVFVLFGVYNLLLFPLFYKTAYKYGAPVIIATVAVVLLATSVELLVVFNGMFRNFMEKSPTAELMTLLVGIVVFVLATIGAFRISARMFEHVDV
jgi:hypothetical protein